MKSVERINTTDALPNGSIEYFSDASSEDVTQLLQQGKKVFLVMTAMVNAHHYPFEMVDEKPKVFKDNGFREWFENPFFFPEKRITIAVL